MKKQYFRVFSQSVEFDVAWWHQQSKVRPDLCLVCLLLPSLSVRYLMLPDENKRDLLTFTQTRTAISGLVLTVYNLFYVQMG